VDASTNVIVSVGFQLWFQLDAYVGLGMILVCSQDFEIVDSPPVWILSLSIDGYLCNLEFV
jgi:hypothetical protein